MQYAGLSSRIGRYNQAPAAAEAGPVCCNGGVALAGYVNRGICPAGRRKNGKCFHRVARRSTVDEFSGKDINKV
jgi:hypothetical protein